jgi:sigma-B regulation protein RsbU (phosphoserine phosphatase)
MIISDTSQSSADRLALLYRLSQTFNSSLDFDEVLNRVMDEVIAVMRAERGFVMLQEAGEDLVFRAARGIDQHTIDDPQFQVSRSVVKRAAREGEPILTSNAQTDDRFSTQQSVILLGLRSILCVPLKVKDKISGVIYVDNRLQAGIFTDEDLELLTAIASSAAIAIENARLYQVAVEKGRLERELQVAYEIQTGLLPHQTPQITGWEFDAHWQPAREVAGDYYDFIPADESRLGLVVADVSGKGMPAAMFMALTRSIIRASVDPVSSPADGISRANRLICADSTGGVFVTLFYGQLNPLTGELIYVNAGHNPPLLYCVEQDELTKLRASGLPLGAIEETEYEQRTAHLYCGDFVVLYTDGMIEATNQEGEEFGLARFQDIILEKRHRPATEIVAALKQALREFVGPSAARFDDITIVVIRRPLE